MTDKRETTAAPSQSFEGLGVALGLTFVGLAALILPLFIETGPVWRTAIYCIALALCGLGVAGALLELSKLRARPSFGDLGAVVFLAALGVMLLLITLRHELATLPAVALRVTAGACLFMGVIGLGIGLGKAHGETAQADRSRSPDDRPDPAERSLRTPSRLTTSDKITLVVSLISALITAGATVVGAIIQGG